MNQSSILLIEDNHKICQFVRSLLENENVHFIQAHSGKEGVASIKQHKPNVVLLDLGLPDYDGLAVIKEVRMWTFVPIIVLSARDHEQDKVMALQLGADDYMTKPFSAAELKARIRVALRHANLIAEAESELITSGAVSIDLVKREVCLQDKPIELTPTQYAMVALLAKHKNRVVTYQEILQTIWGANHHHDQEILRIYIHQIRNKLEAVPSSPTIFMTEPGVGYRLLAEE